MLGCIFGALSLLAWCWKHGRAKEAPRIRAMRGDDEGNLSEWSVIDTRSELRAERGFRKGVLRRVKRLVV